MREQSRAMVRLTNQELNETFVDALAPVVTRIVDNTAPVLELQLAAPYPPRLRVYLYNATNPQGGRSTPEHKIQLAAPGQVKGERANFDFTGGYSVLLVGKVEDEDAFVLWDASLYRDFTHSSNVQVRTETIEEALATGTIQTQERNLRRGVETVLAAPSALLPQAVLMRLPAGSHGPVPPPAPATPGPPARPAPATGGKVYVTPPRAGQPVTPKSRVFEFDPNLIDRGTNAHKDVQDKLATRVTEQGLVPLSPETGDPEFDIAWVDGDVAYVGEVKSLTDENEESQLRLGLGQVLSYVYRLDWEVGEVQGVLAVEREPSASYWVDMCATHNVILTWLEEFPRLFSDDG
jgi:hypothetical protein